MFYISAENVLIWEKPVFIWVHILKVKDRSEITVNITQRSLLFLIIDNKFIRIKVVTVGNENTDYEKHSDLLYQQSLFIWCLPKFNVCPDSSVNHGFIYSDTGPS
jgi:hypothetical protein